MSESNNDLNHSILNLTPQEKSAYSYLFGLADTDSINVVTGERAVNFFEKTSVPSNVLGEIWQIADTENRGLLTKPGFCMVLRLIGWYQNGQQQPTTELAFKPAPIPKFDGITLPSAPPQSATSPTSGSFPPGALQPQLSGQNTGGPIRVPPLDPAKVQQYSGLFGRSGAQNGLLDGGTAKSIFEKANLPNETLGKIWMLSDREQRGGLDETEFIVAMHLLTSMKTRAMTALPNTLPPGLYEAAARRGQRPPSRQMSQQGGAVPRQFTGTGVGAPQRTQSPLARPSSSSQSPAVQSTPQAGGQHWLITQQEKAQYDQYFSTVDTAGQGVISGEQAVQFFSNSRLPEDTLASIWDLADINSEGQLNKDEFAVAMYLIRQQKSPNAAPLPAFLPPALIPPSMRNQQPAQQAQAQTSSMQASPFDPFNPAPTAPKASDDLFGLDSSPTQTQPQPQQSVLQPQGTGASATRDPFGGSQGSAPGSPARFAQQQQGGTTFKPFVPTSAFGASLAQQHTGSSATSSQPQQAPRAPMPSTMDDLLGDNEAHTAESSKLTNETTELANMSNQIGNLRSQMETTQNQKTQTAGQLQAANTQKRDLEQRLQQFRSQYEAEVKTVKEMEQQLAASRDATKKLSQEAAMLEGTYQDLQSQHNTVAQQLQADQQENANLKQRISQMNAEVSRLKPEIEKMKLDARQQKGLVSINKKQLATNESERDRLQGEKADLEREAGELARSAAASPEPAVTSQASNVVSPAAGMSSTNPFFRKASQEAASTPPATTGPTPSAFDALFGPSTAFAPSGQAGSRSGTPPATSFIGRSMPSAGTAAAVGAGAAATSVGGMALADSLSSLGEPTPSSSPQVSDSAKQSPLEISAPSEPPPPPESRQFTPTHLPIGGGVVGQPDSDAGSSVNVIPPASRAGGTETPREMVASPPPVSGTGGSITSPLTSEPLDAQREVVPGAFPSDELQPTTSHQEIVPSDPSTQNQTPAAQPKATDDFDSAFASFGQGDKTTTSEDPFAPSADQSGSTQTRGFDSEFPPIQNLEQDDDSDSSDDSEEGGFDDNFTSSPQQNGAPATSTEPSVPHVASGDEIAAARPPMKSVESTASDLPGITKEISPPTYQQSDSTAHGGSGERSASNQFPPEFGNLLPSREDPTSPPPPPEDEIKPAPLPANNESEQNLATPLAETPAKETVTTPATDVFVDASSRPTSNFFGSINQSTPSSSTQAPKNAFDDFDDFADLSEAKEADKSGSDFDFGFGRQSQDEFNPAFDSPAVSSTPTQNRSVQQSQESNGFANFAPNVSTSTDPFGSGSGGDSIQQTPQNVQHDWDAIFSGLDNSKDIDTSFANSNDPWSTNAAATTNGNNSTVAPPTSSPQSAGALGKAGLPELGRAITPGTEHDDPILKRLTGMGYPRADALNALEMYDYDINKAVDHLTSS